MLMGEFPIFEVNSKTPASKEALPETVDPQFPRVGAATFSRFSQSHSIVNRDEETTYIFHEDE